MRSWYKIQNNNSGVLDVSIHDEIGAWGVNAKDFISSIKDVKGVREINLSVHSPGGSVFDGLAIYNALANHPAKVYGKVEGLAASAASFLLMGADVVSMPEDAFMMIHNPWTMAFGEADDMRETADLLDKMRDTLVNIYAKKSGLATETVSELMADETWMTGDEAKDYGFVDVVTNAAKVAALAPGFEKHFQNIPEQMKEKPALNISSLKEFEQHLRDACGCSRKEATALTSIARGLFQSDSEEAEEAKTLNAIDQLSKVLNNGCN